MITGIAGTISQGVVAIGLDVLRGLQHHAVADRRRLQAEAEEAQRRLGDDHLGDGQRDAAMMWLKKDGTMCRKMMRGRLAPLSSAADDEVLLAQRQEAAAHDARQLGPAEDREDDGDGEIDLKTLPVARQRGGEPHPERDGRDRAEDLDDALDDGVDDAAEEARDAAEHDAEHQAEHHADEADRHRDLRREEKAREDVAALHVGAEEEERLVGARALEAEEVDVRGDEPEELVVEAAREEPQLVLLSRGPRRRRA